MLIENIITDLLSNDSKMINKGLNSCLLDLKIITKDSGVFNVLYKLLGHSEYEIRHKTEKLLKFFIQNNPNQVSLFYDNLHMILSEANNETLYHYSRLIGYISKNLEGNLQSVLEILNSEGYPQCIAIFILREIPKKNASLLVNELFKMLSTENESQNILGSCTNNADNKTMLKKAICWIFWENLKLIFRQSLELIFFLTNDEDREVRRLSCEILAPLLKNDDYRSGIIETFENRLSDSSGRVQRFVIKNLLSITTYFPQEEVKFLDRIINIFSHEDWQKRKIICESLPPESLFHNYGTNTKLLLNQLVNMLNDQRWEVRETAIISLSRHLNFTEKENRQTLIRIHELTNDEHEQVRKISCRIISQNMNINQDLKNQFYETIIYLVKDRITIVREEALNSLYSQPISEILVFTFPEILDGLFLAIKDADKNVRGKAWLMLNKLTNNLSEQHFHFIIDKILYLTEDQDAEIRCFSLTLLKGLLANSRTNKSLIYTATYLRSWKQKVLELLRDNEATVSIIAWEILLENKSIFIDMKKDLRNIFLDLNIYSPQISPHLCEICLEFGLIEQDASIRDILTQLLCKTDNREVKKSILNIFLPFKEKMYLNERILFQLIHDGQWDVQEKVCQFLIPLIKENINSKEFYKYLNEIINLFEDPIKKFDSSSSKQANSITMLSKDFGDILSEKEFVSFFNDSNDDMRFERWLQLEEKFDLIKKIGHPDSSIIIEKFVRMIDDQIAHLNKDLGYHEVLRENIGLDTPFKIVNLMRGKQEFVRLSMLKNIEKDIDFSQGKFDLLRKAILILLDDSSLAIRHISWNIFRNKIIPSTGLEKNLETIFYLMNSTNTDTKIKTISILSKLVSQKKVELEYILNHLVNFIDDNSFLVRVQIWSLFETDINLSFPKYNYIVMKILTLISHSNIEVRNEASQFIERNLKVFLKSIDIFPQPPNVLHLLGEIWGKKGDFDKSIQFFYQIIEEKPLDINSWLALALIYIQKRDFNETLRILAKIQHEIDQFDYRTYLVWSECLLEMGNQLEAKKMDDIAQFLKR